MIGKRFSTTRPHRVDLLFALALVCVFALSCVFAVVAGAGVYQNTVASMEQNGNLHTALIYLWEKVKQGDVQGGIHLEEVAGSPSLVLEQTRGEDTYQTWIYPYDGGLRELMIPKGREFSPADGAVVLELEGISIGMTEDGLFRFSVPDENGNPVELLVKPRS